jgi:hypothetical protein
MEKKCGKEVEIMKNNQAEMLEMKKINKSNANLSG